MVVKNPQAIVLRLKKQVQRLKKKESLLAGKVKTMHAQMHAIEVSAYCKGVADIEKKLLTNIRKEGKTLGIALARMEKKQLAKTRKKLVKKVILGKKPLRKVKKSAGTKKTPSRKK